MKYIFFFGGYDTVHIFLRKNIYISRRLRFLAAIVWSMRKKKKKT